VEIVSPFTEIAAVLTLAAALATPGLLLRVRATPYQYNRDDSALR
jgi:hypothetical protein